MSLRKLVGSEIRSPSVLFNLTEGLAGEETGLQPVKPNSERMSRQYFRWLRIKPYESEQPQALRSILNDQDLWYGTDHWDKT